MHVHMVQLEIVWEDRDANHARVRTLLKQAGVEPGDLVVLPELFDVGFTLNVGVANDSDQRTLGYLRELSAELSCVVHGSRCVGGDPPPKLATNRATICDRGELICEYAKVHPFSFGREPEAYVGGDRVATYRWGESPELCVCPAVCYDLRFPELFRAGLLDGAAMYVLGANWPEARHEHWRALLIARAIENQAYVVGVNRAGADPHLAYAGGSMVVDPKGVIVSEAGRDECVVSVPIEIERVDAWRRAFGAWQDHRLLRDAVQNRVR